MTFLEAAIEILRNAQDPLHFSEIARAAVDRGLLSHVGRDPEATMRSCLTSAVRGGNDPILLRVKPGHYVVRPGAELPEPPPMPVPKKAAPPEPEAEAEEAPAPRPRKKRSTKAKTKTKTKAKKTSSRRAAEPAEEPAEEASPAEPPEESVAIAAEESVAEETPAPAEEVETDASEDDDGAAEESADSGESSGGKRKRRRRGSGSRFGVRGEAPPPQVVAVKPSRRGADPSRRNDVIQKVQNLEFEAPQGSGLEGVTDVAVVMANAMSRLVEERPELRGELELIQQRAQAQVERQSERQSERQVERHSERHSERQSQSRRSRDDEEKGGRRRRRRRRRNKRVEWTDSSNEGRQSEENLRGTLLLQVAKVLEGASGRSLHIRQLAEQLANQNVLGGEVSEVERAVSAAVLTDIHRHGRHSRFVARGDARYQLQGSRLPVPSAIAEDTLRVAAQAVAAETDRQLLHWVRSLGLRGLEALVRMYLAEEGYEVKASLAPGKGVGRLLAVDPDPDDDDPKVMVVVAPRKSSVDAGAWTYDVDRITFGGVLVFSMADESVDFEDARVIQAPELGRWLREHGIGVEVVKVEVPALDPTLIESISGLDT